MLALLLLAPALAAPGSVSSWEPARVSEASVMLATGGCLTRFQVGADGVPTQVEVQACASSVRAAVSEAAMRWRFEPLGEAPFTWQGTVPVAPPALDLPLADPGPPLDAPLPADTAPVIRKSRQPATPAALRSALHDLDRRFAYERCTVQVRVGPDGRVSSARPTACAALLWPAVERAAFKTRYDPAFRDGQPVPALVDLELVVELMP